MSGIISLVLIYFVSAIILGLIPVNKEYKHSNKGIEIFVTTNNVHLDIVVPVVTPTMDWRNFISPSRFHSSVIVNNYIGFGWGERNFYINTPTWADLEAGVAIKAMLWPTPTAMHVSYYGFVPLPNSQTKSIILSEKQYNQLVDYIIQSFQREDGMPILIENSGYHKDDNFYEAHGNYHLFYTSNEWVNEALKDIGVRTALWSPFDKAVLYHLEKINSP